ncbi:plasmid mobilization protein [Marivita sp. S0852]|uniref:plasmid mobilization protein n=1 Tax=Marivita sp. S0852 TaxID=3373893 RepID=UPI003981CB01
MDRTSRFDFNKIAAEEVVAEKKYPPPFSLRLTHEERARLEAEAGDLSLSAYIRECLFGEEASPRKASGKRPVEDKEALGRVMGALGNSRLSSNLNQLAKAVNTGSLPVTPETEAELVEACEGIAQIRADLLKALGLTPEGGP